MVRCALYRRVHDTDVYVLLVRTAEKWSRLKRGQACTLQTRPRYRRIRPTSANGRKVVAYHFTDASRIRQYTGVPGYNRRLESWKICYGVEAAQCRAACYHSNMPPIVFACKIFTFTACIYLYLHTCYIRLSAYIYTSTPFCTRG